MTQNAFTRAPLVLVELSPTIDPAEWILRHARGEVPDRVPYGFDRLTHYGFTLRVRRPPTGQLTRTIAHGCAKIGGGYRWWECLTSSRQAADIDMRVCWDERLGAPAIADEARRRSPRPVISGVIWITDEPAEKPMVKLGARFLRRADALFVSSAAQVEPLVRKWRVEVGRVHFVPFGVDADFWLPVPTERVSDLIISVGNDRHRDYPTLVDAMRSLVVRVPPARLHLVTGQNVSLPPHVGRRTPFLRHDQLRQLYSTATVAVVSTRHNLHASGLTATLEAMAMGLPVIASAAPGLEDYVTNGVTGLLVRPGDSRGLADALSTLLQDPDMRDALGREARRQVLERFSTEHQAARMAHLLKSTI